MKPTTRMIEFTPLTQPAKPWADKDRLAFRSRPWEKLNATLLVLECWAQANR